MAPLNEQQLEQIRDDRREQIKKAALKVFARRGIVGTKMSMIAAEAGISQGLSYRYFSSKDELFVELVQEAMEEAQSAVEALPRLPGTPLEQFRTLTEGMLAEGNRHAFLLIQQVQTSDEVPEKAKRIVERHSSAAMIDRLLPLFEKGQQAGEFCPGNPRRLLFGFFSVVTGLMLQQFKDEGDEQMPDVDLILKIITK